MEKNILYRSEIKLKRLNFQKDYNDLSFGREHIRKIKKLVVSFITCSRN